MAKLDGIIKITGRLGDQCFYRLGNQYVVRRVPKAYKRSEYSDKSARDFGTASRNAAYIRKAFEPLVQRYGDKDLINRLNGELLAIFKGIDPERAGDKQLIDGNIRLLEGFEFNAQTHLNTLLLTLPKVVFPGDGLVELSLPKTEMQRLVKAVSRSDNFVLQLMLFHFDLNGDAYEILRVNDLQVSLSASSFPGARLSLPIDLPGDRALFIALGISYLHEKLVKQDRRYLACKLVYARHLRDGVEVDFVPPPVSQKAVELEQDSGLNWEMGEG